MRKGFTLIELLIFVGIFSVMIIAFMTVFVSVSQIQVRQTSSAEVAAQSQLLLQQIQYYVERSSLIEMAANSATSTLRLRMASSTEDVTTIKLVNGAVTLQPGSGALQTLTSSKVTVSNLQFTKRENPPGHDSVAITFTMEFNSSNGKMKFVEGFNTSIARVSAASFDSDVIASSSNTYALGTASGNWKSINGTTIQFSGSNVGIGVLPTKGLQLAGDDFYISTAAKGIVLKGPNGTSCYTLTITNTGAFSTSSVTCP
jgi:type II secretory pathway pseudopilin PulG